MKQIIQKAKYMAVLIIIALGFSLAFSAPSASAAESLFSGAKREACAGTQLQPVSQGGSPNCTADDEGRLVGTIKKGINFFSVIIGIIAVVMVVIGGFRYIISDGDSGKITTARNTIIYALVGLLLVAFAQVIVRFVLART